MSGGIDSGELAAAVATVTGVAELAALTISAYGPVHDTGAAVRAALRETLAAVRS